MHKIVKYGRCIGFLMEILGVAKVHGNGRIQLPKQVRERLKVEDGDYVYFYVEKGKIVVEKSSGEKSFSYDGTYIRF